MFRPFILSFVAAVCLCWLALTALIELGGDHIPAPQLSTSESFNEKARWLQGALQQHQCDILVVGSSISLNSVDGRLLSERTGKSVVNLASWGLTPEETRTLATLVSRICRPQIVLMATYQGDYTAKTAASKSINWTDVDAYIQGKGRTLAYFRSFDLSEFLMQMTHQKNKTLTTNAQSLAFDTTGSVNLACEGFHYSAARWNGYKTERPPIPDPAAVEDIVELARLSASWGAQLVLAVAPIRPIAEQEYYPEARAELWAEIRGKIEQAGGSFIRIDNSNNRFADAEFVDYDHLNACGAKRWTELLASQLPR